MKIEFEDRTWEYDEDAVTVKQAVAMQLAYGFTLGGWHTAMGEIDARAWQCAYWLMLQQNGITKTIKDCDFEVVKFAEIVVDAGLAAKAASEAGDGDEPDPTSPAPGSPASPEPSTPKATTPREAPHGTGS